METRSMRREREEREGKENDNEPPSQKPDAKTTCSICLNIVKDPKTLACGHIFCIKCIRQWAKTNQSTITGPSCAMCRAPFKLQSLYKKKLAQDPPRAYPTEQRLWTLRTLEEAVARIRLSDQEREALMRMQPQSVQDQYARLLATQQEIHRRLREARSENQQTEPN